MTITHTPGPWTDLGTAIGVAYRGEGGESDQLIPIVLKDKPSIWDEDEYQANSRLIAAAPDLLAALQELMAFAEPILQNHGFGYMGKFKKARAAIAKATG